KLADGLGNPAQNLNINASAAQFSHWSDFGTDRRLSQFQCLARCLERACRQKPNDELAPPHVFLPEGRARLPHLLRGRVPEAGLSASPNPSDEGNLRPR